MSDAMKLDTHDFQARPGTTVDLKKSPTVVDPVFESKKQYRKLLESDSAEVEALYMDVLINVTSFFRDPETFEALKILVFPQILKDKRPDASIRIWVTGCSSGREAYNLSILLLEFLVDMARPPPFQIFARHDMVADPPFSRVDLITCRNVLIYLRADRRQPGAPAIPRTHPILFGIGEAKDIERAYALKAYWIGHNGYSRLVP